MKKLSIITICKNNKEIKNTCESVINQSFQDFEWIVIDGNSTDNTLKILENYKSKITTLVSEPDEGIYDAMNKGIDKATGEYLLFLNGGDELCDDVLAKVFAVPQTEDILYGDISYWHQELMHNICAKKLPEKIDADFFITNTIYHPASFIKRNLFALYGKYNNDYKIVSDWAKFIVFIKNNVSFKKLNLIITYFKNGGISTNKTFSEIHKNERAKVLKEHYTTEELKNHYKKALKWYHYIFSLKNEMPFKVLRIFNMEFKLKEYGL